MHRCRSVMDSILKISADICGTGSIRLSRDVISSIPTLTGQVFRASIWICLTTEIFFPAGAVYGGPSHISRMNVFSMRRICRRCVMRRSRRTDKKEICCSFGNISAHGRTTVSQGTGASKSAGRRRLIFQRILIRFN